MDTARNKFTDSLNIISSIAAKDILDVFKNRGTRTNLIILLGIVVFFHWMLNLRPFDKTLDVVVYDQGSNLQLESAELSDGSEIRIINEESMEDMQNRLGFQDLGIVLTSDLQQTTASGDALTLEGYIFWEKRASVAELESLYSLKFSEYLDRSVQINIAENIIVPLPEQATQASTAMFYTFFAIFYMAVAMIPIMMLEEFLDKTLDAMLVSPASHAQIVLGKGLAGCFYMVIAGVLSLYLNAAYVTNWLMISVGFVCAIAFSVCLGLALGSLIKSRQQVQLATLPVVFLLLVPALFAREPNLAPGLKSVISLLPTSAISRLISLGTTSSIPLDVLAMNLSISIASTLLLFGFILWQLRRSDR